MTLPKNITDAIDTLLQSALKTLTSAYAMPADEYLRICTGPDRAALEAAIAAAIQPVERATGSWNGGPTITALMRGVEDAAIEWGKCCGDYHAACQAAPPPSGLQATDAVREAGHRCELTYGYFQKAIKALADHGTQTGSLERLRERVQDALHSQSRRTVREGDSLRGSAPLDRRGAGGGAMTDRLTDDEIAKLRYYKDACVHSPEWRLTFMGIPMDAALDRLLDEIEERRRAERSVATVFDEAAEPMTAEQWSKFQALMPKRKDGGA